MVKLSQVVSMLKHIDVDYTHVDTDKIVVADLHRDCSFYFKQRGEDILFRIGHATVNEDGRIVPYGFTVEVNNLSSLSYCCYMTKVAKKVPTSRAQLDELVEEIKKQGWVDAMSSVVSELQ